MAVFMTRVELHDATERDYYVLHASMEIAGFSRLIRSDKGVWYNLLTAEYNRIGDLTIAQVTESAIKAASATNKKFGVFVTEAKNQMWEGLTVYNQ